VKVQVKACALSQINTKVTMKGLYFQKSSTNEEITFVFQERVVEFSYTGDCLKGKSSCYRGLLCESSS